MAGEHYFVGGVALLLGIGSLVASLKNEERFFQLAKLQLLQATFGRLGSRWICGLLGCALMILGVCILLGWLPRKPSPLTTRPAACESAGVAFAC
jgi:hypothetical protein